MENEPEHKIICRKCKKLFDDPGVAWQHANVCYEAVYSQQPTAMNARERVLRDAPELTKTNMNPTALQILKAFAEQVLASKCDCPEPYTCTVERQDCLRFMARAALAGAMKAESVPVKPCGAMAWTGERCVLGRDDGHLFHAAGSTWRVRP